MPARVVQFSLDSLPTDIPKIFAQVQLTSANHQKNYVALYKLQTEAAKITESVQNGRSIKLVGERAFEDTLLSMLSRALPIKKGESVADRVIKFIGGYTKFINEKLNEERRRQEVEVDEEDDSTESRFVSRLLKFLFKGSLAKDKVVRYRVIQCIAEMISHLGEIDEDVYKALRTCLIERVRDKETPVRVQAVIALSRLCGADDPSEEPTIAEILIDTLFHDSAADVRRAVLVNLPLSPATIPVILSRTRDTDATIRKLVYSHVLDPNCIVMTGPEGNEEAMGMTHPRALTIAQRELIVRNGLGDREEAVKAATRKLVVTWVEVARSTAEKAHDNDPKPKTEDGEEQKPTDPVREDLVAFLKLFDLEENSTAEDALLNVFKARPDIVDVLEFDNEYWKAMTPERAFLARIFVDHCIANKNEARFEGAMPVVTALAFHLQAAYNELIEEIQTEEEEALLRGDIDDDEENDARAKREEARLDHEFVIGEMLRTMVNLDYGDEIGRRRMFQLVRGMICRDVLPESLVARCLDVMRKLSPNERDLIRVVVEVVHELRDPPVDEDEALQRDDSGSNIGETPMTVRTVRQPKPAPDEEVELTPEQQARADAIDLRCLALCIGMLERVNGTFEENSTLEGILGELIIPAVKRKELPLRERGLVCLGLCCLIARRMAMNSFQLFLSQVQSAPEALKIRVLHVVFDILMVHDRDFLGPGSPTGERIVEFLLHILNQEDSDKVQAVICVGISKLMLSGMISDERVLSSLMLVYVSPDTASNQELRQCLSYFFPVYCYSSPINQRRMQQAFMPLYEKLNEAYQEWDGDEDMISPAQACLMMVDWTDPQKASAVAKHMGHKVDLSIHIDLASDIIKSLFNDELKKDDKKALCQLLGKLHIPEEIDDDKIRTLKLLMHNLRLRRPLQDTTSKNAFNKFEANITKKYEKQLSDFSEEEYRQLEYLQDLFAFLDDIDIQEDDDDVVELPKKKGGKKRRSGSLSSDSTSVSGMSADESTPPTSSRRASGKGKAKRRRLSQSDDESIADDTSTTRETSVPEAPKRVMPRRSAADKSRIAVSKNLAPPPSETDESSSEGGGDEQADDDDEEEEEDDDSGEQEDDDKTPAASRLRRISEAALSHVQAIADVGAKLEAARADSIMDSSDSEDADEVDDLL